MERKKGKLSPLQTAGLLLASALFLASCLYFRAAPWRMIGAGFCHQIKARSPEFDFPFCYRCSGMFSGIVIGIISFFALRKRGGFLSASSLLALGAALIIFLTDVVNSSALIPVSWYTESAESRFLTAFPFGYCMANIILPILPHFYEQNQTETKKVLWKSLLFFAGGFGSMYLMLFCRSRFLSGLVLVLICTGCLFFVDMLYAILIKCIAILFKKSCPLQTALSWGLTAGLTQITLIGSLHLKLLGIGFFPA